MKFLIVEHPGLRPQSHPWNRVTQELFNLDRFDAVSLAEGETIWLGGTAFSIEESEEAA